VAAPTNVGVNGTCTGSPPPTCTAGTAREWTVHVGWDTNSDGKVDTQNSDPLLTRNVDGCEVIAEAVKDCWSNASASTKVYCTMSGKESGTAAASEPTPDVESGTGPCPAGQTYGTVNDIPTCLQAGTPDVPTAPAKTTSTQSTVTNGDGSKTVTSTTSSSSSTTTTTTTYDAAGNKTGETTETRTNGSGVARGATEQADYCRDNPNSPMCKSGSWSGSCAAFTCDGDAVQCAQAQASWKLTCALTEANAQATLADQIASGNDPLAATLPNPAAPSIINIGAIDQSAWAGGSCPPDVTVPLPLGAGPLVLPFSSMCVYLEWFGYAVIVVSMLGAARIIGVWG